MLAYPSLRICFYHFTFISILTNNSCSLIIFFGLSFSFAYRYLYPITTCMDMLFRPYPLARSSPWKLVSDRSISLRLLCLKNSWFPIIKRDTGTCPLSLSLNQLINPLHIHILPYMISKQIICFFTSLSIRFDHFMQLPLGLFVYEFD